VRFTSGKLFKASEIRIIGKRSSRFRFGATSVGALALGGLVFKKEIDAVVNFALGDSRASNAIQGTVTPGVAAFG
jgi:hypothetical protein